LSRHRWVHESDFPTNGNAEKKTTEGNNGLYSDSILTSRNQIIKKTFFDRADSEKPISNYGPSKPCFTPKISVFKPRKTRKEGR